MPSTKLRGGKTTISLYEIDKRRTKDARELCHFIARNSPPGELQTAANTAADALNQVALLLAVETPEVDTPNDLQPVG